MNRGRVGEERGGKEMDGCPLTLLIPQSSQKELLNYISQRSGSTMGYL
jgi:hypothetical protein